MAKSPVVDLGGDGASPENAAFSCRALRDHFEQNHYSWSGLYFLKQNGAVLETYCDQSSYSGGWTLLVHSYTPTGWSTSNVLRRGTITLAFTQDFSMLGLADYIKSAPSVR